MFGPPRGRPLWLGDVRPLRLRPQRRGARRPVRATARSSTCAGRGGQEGDGARQRRRDLRLVARPPRDLPRLDGVRQAHRPPTPSRWPADGRRLPGYLSSYMLQLAWFWKILKGVIALFSSDKPKPSDTPRRPRRRRRRRRSASSAGCSARRASGLARRDASGRLSLLYVRASLACRNIRSKLRGKRARRRLHAVHRPQAARRNWRYVALAHSRSVSMPASTSRCSCAWSDAMPASSSARSSAVETGRPNWK